MGARLYFLLIFIVLSVRQQDALFQELPWVLRRFFAQELVNFYTTISQNEENTLIRAFMLSQGDRTRASQLVEQMDLKLHRYYQEVFPAYYAKLDGLSPQTRRFYKEIVLDEIKRLIRKGSTQHDFFKHFAVIQTEWNRLSEASRAELYRQFSSVASYLDSPEFRRRAALGADYDD